METKYVYRDTQGRPIASAPPIRHYTVSEYLDYEILRMAKGVPEGPFVIEVLGETHEAYDRGEKFARYRSLPSLQEYVLVASEDSRVDRFTRLTNGNWLLNSVSGLDASVTFETLGFSVPLSELYYDIEFEPPCWEKIYESYY